MEFKRLYNESIRNATDQLLQLSTVDGDDTTDVDYRNLSVREIQPP
jgi:hypothetical protein